MESVYSETFDVLAHLLASVFNQTELDVSLVNGQSEGDWERLFSLSCQHDMAAIVSDVISSNKCIEIPIDIRLKFVGMQDLTESNYKHHIDCLMRLLHFFSRHHVQTMLFKGLSIASYYPIPHHRKCGDMDIYQFGDNEKSDQLTSKEFQLDVRRFVVSHHTNYVFQGVNIENHFQFLTTYYGGKVVELEKILEREAFDGRRELPNIPDAFAPSPTFNAIYLMFHAAGHFMDDGLSIRQLVDWMMFLKSEYDKVDWERVQAIYKEYHVDRFVSAVNSVLIRHFGMPKRYVYADVIDDGLEQQIYSDVMCHFPVKESDINGRVNIRDEWNQYISNGWKYRIFNRRGWVEALKKIIAYLRHPQDFVEKVILSSGDLSVEDN